MFKRPHFEPAAPVKVMPNIGALMDIPTGTFIQGKYGEWILNGGMAFVTGIAGIGNNFKSTIMDYMSLTAMVRIWYATPTYLNTYDTEVNIHETHKRNFFQRYMAIFKEDILNTGAWTITDKTKYSGNKWYEIHKEHMVTMRNTPDKDRFDTPFLNRDGKTLFRIPTPTFAQVDSFTRFETDDVAKIQDENELGDSGGNTMHMRQGLAKSRFLLELPGLTGASYNYMMLTAHIGKEIAMASGPMAPPPPKKLQHLKHGDKLKGTTDQFTFLTGNCWQAFNAAPMINQLTKGPEYPITGKENHQGDTDLNCVKLRQLRGKSGPSGMNIDLIVSQTEGVLASLTEFHYLKENGRFGLDGSDRNYSITLCPGISLSRTTVRSKIDEHPKLRRALNIQAEMLQMQQLWADQGDLPCAPHVLYNELKAKGYDWDILLETRGWWTLDNDKQDIPFLSTMDLLKMRIGEYHPYWYPVKKEDLKPVKL